MRKLKSHMQRTIKAVGLVAAVMGAGGCSDSDNSNNTMTTGRVPTVDATELEGPITSGTISLPTDLRAFDVSTIGYVQEEWFASGIATAYTAVGDLGLDGRWVVQPASTAAYK